MLYSKWLGQGLVGRIQNKFPPIIFSLASLGFGGNLRQLFFVNIPSTILRPDKYKFNTGMVARFKSSKVGVLFEQLLPIVGQ